VVWAGIAAAIGYSSSLGGALWGGILVSPLIGLVAGRCARIGMRQRPWLRMLYTLAALYGSAALFGLGMGIWAWTSSYPHTAAAEVLLSHVYIVILGITISGYFLVLWPLSHLNHRYLWRVIAEEIEETHDAANPVRDRTT
jgi:hypothetical protein